ncbi:MAG: cysteine desulfurase [Deltaproteobacteria bacterium]|nr:cysteine desulfurase [Deltaproteobacteria bacterium]
MNDPIYLDHNATTPLLPEVVEVMLPYLQDHYGNPSSGHVYGRRAKAAVEEARAQVAAMIGAAPEEILFTSGGTEANNLAIRGVTASSSGRNRIWSRVIEHPATTRPIEWLAQHGFRAQKLGVDEVGQVRLDQAHFDDHTQLVTVMHANNETGVLQPIAELSQQAHRVGALMHSDAAQSLGKVPVQVDALGVDLLSIAGHKLYAPKGVGALYVRRGTPLSPLLLGANHEGGLRPGTENVASIVGLGAACRQLASTLEAEGARTRGLRDLLFQRLQQSIPALALNGHPEQRLPNTLNIRFPGVRGDQILAAAPEVAASTGSACHDGDHQASAVITAMGISSTEALGSVRLSLGRGTTSDQVERAAVALTRAYRSVTSEVGASR